MIGAIRRHKPDVILGYEFSFTTQFLILLKVLGFLPQVIGSTIDDSPAICARVQSQLRRMVRRLSVNRLDRLVVLSNEVADFYSEKFAFPRNRIVVSPLLQEPDSLRRTPRIEIIAEEYVKKWNLSGKKIILFVGRFIPEKGLPNFVSTIANSLKSRQDVRLLLVGDGPDRPIIEAMIRSTNLQGQVLMPGRFEGADLLAWYLSATGFVLPSLYEPFGAVVNEALIFGLPVLCSDRAGSASLALESGGRLFDPSNRHAMGEAYSSFVAQLPVLADSKLDHRPSLAKWNSANFRTEWRKLKWPQ